jgi:hypothetical protein
MLIEAMATHEALKKTSLNPIWKENTTLPFQIHLILGQNVMSDS